MKIIKTVFLATCLTVFSLGLKPVALAHQYAADGDMHVTMHIDPDDFPVINEPQTFEFIYEAQNFDARNCTCSMDLKDGNKQVLKTKVPAVNQYYGKFDYTFSKPGVYNVILTGVPKSTTSFKPFGVSYNIRVSAVERDGTPAPPAPSDWKDKIIIIGAGAVVVLSLLACWRVVYEGSKKAKKKGSKK